MFIFWPGVPGRTQFLHLGRPLLHCSVLVKIIALSCSRPIYIALRLKNAFHIRCWWIELSLTSRQQAYESRLTRGSWVARRAGKAIVIRAHIVSLSLPHIAYGGFINLFANYWARNNYFPQVAWNWVINLRFVHPKKAGECNFFT